MSIRGHSQCVQYLKSKNIPLVVIGGGGYTIANVARCWCYETGVIAGLDVEGKIPEDDEFYYMYTAGSQSSN